MLAAPACICGRWAHIVCRSIVRHSISTRRFRRPTARADVDKTGNCDAARAVGKAIAERAKAAGVEKVAFDRGGFAYHGRVKALADAARESGLQF